MSADVRFPLKDVIVRKVIEPRLVSEPLYDELYWQMNQREFAMQVDGVGSFYACNGTEVEYAPADGAGNNEIELYLNGSVYGAILHQRKILPLHGSSFRHNGITVVVCGDTGAGKSSVTAAFCLDGAEFLTDDVTPVVIKEGIPCIMALSDRMKLWADTLKQLEKEVDGLTNIHRRTDKFYLPMERAPGDFFRPDLVLLIEVKEYGDADFSEVTGAGQFTALRAEIYRPEYLPGMPENEQAYFETILAVCRNTRMIRITRPAEISIYDLHRSISEYLSGYVPEKH